MDMQHFRVRLSFERVILAVRLADLKMLFQLCILSPTYFTGVITTTVTTVYGQNGYQYLTQPPYSKCKGNGPL